MDSHPPATATSWRIPFLRPIGTLALSASLAFTALPAVAQQSTPTPAPTPRIDFSVATVALHDGTCAMPTLEPEFEIGDMRLESYGDVLDEFREDALDEDVPPGVAVPGPVAPNIIDEDVNNNATLDEGEDLDGDNVIDFGLDDNADGLLSDDELLNADAALLIGELPRVWRADEEIDATFDELFGITGDGVDEGEDDDALSNTGVVAIHASAADYGTIVACGEMVAPNWENEDDVVVGLRGTSGSNAYGFAVFQRDTGNIPVFGDNTTGVTVYMFEDVSTLRSGGAATPVPTPVASQDADNDGILNVDEQGYLTEDADGDGVLDDGEDLDGDGILDEGIDANGDGILDDDETFA